MKNRYKDILQTYNSEILMLVPSNLTLRYILGLELRRAYKKGMRVLEIGCGEGDSAKYLLVAFPGKLELLDVSREMLAVARKNLRQYRSRLKFICADALEYLKQSRPYHIITASWVPHNFKSKENQLLLAEIYKKLTLGGMFLLMDKIYPGKNDIELLKSQLARYDYMTDVAARRAIIAHELTDYSKDYRLDQKQVVKFLKKLGFKKVQIADRVERDVVLVAQK